MIRRDLDEERTLVELSDAGSDSESEETKRSEDSERSSIFNNEDRLQSGSHMSRGNSRRNRAIFGATGSIRKLRYIHGKPLDQSIASPLSFRLYNNTERLSTAHHETTTLFSIFWMALGFMPTWSNDSGHHVWSIEDPVRDVSLGGITAKPVDSHTPEDEAESTHVYGLEYAQDRPRSIRLAAEAFGVAKTSIDYWADITDTISSIYSRNLSNHYVEVCRNGRISPSMSRLISTEGVGGASDFVVRADLEALIRDFLALEWSPLGFLVWKLNTRLLTTLLSRTAQLYQPLLSVIWQSSPDPFYDQTMFRKLSR